MPVFTLPKSSHPDFALPNVKPRGPIQIDRSNEFGAHLDVAIMFDGPSTAGDVNAIDQPWGFYDVAKNHIHRGATDWDYSQFFEVKYNARGPYLNNNYGAGGNVKGKLDNAAMDLKRCVANNAYTIVTNMIIGGSDVSATNSPNFFSTGGVKFCQFAAISCSTSQIVIRAINESRWTAADDETFTNTMDAGGKEYFLAMAYSGAAGVRDVHFDNQVATRTSFTGTAIKDEAWGVTDEWCRGFNAGTEIGCSYLFIFNKYFSPAQLAEYKAAQYQVFEPAIPLTYFVPAAAAGGFQAAWARNANTIIQQVTR